MADTMRGDWPSEECSDCGTKGVVFKHWGPLVKPGDVGQFCGECWVLRDQNSTVQPLGYRKQKTKKEI